MDTQVIKLIQERRRHTIFVLWGKHAQKFKEHIHIAVLASAHPAAEVYSGNKAGFYGNGHFLNINERLQTRNLPKIDWFQLPAAVAEEEQIKMYDNE